MSLNYFFKPRAIAVVGASSNRQKIGRQIFDNIIKGGYEGKIYPINLTSRSIANRLAYSSLSELPRMEFKSMLVVIAIPAPLVIDEIKKCAKLGIKNIIIISAGFRESGAAGKRLEKKNISLAAKYQLNILGPNCLGMINTFEGINTTFASAKKQIGNIAFLSQSGAIGSAALDWLKNKNINFGYFVSLGNKAVMTENDILEQISRDSRIDLIVAYLEEIQSGQELMTIISRIAKRKPVAILKSGQSDLGRKIALSHTGSLAGSQEVIKTGLQRAGAIWLDNLEDLFNLLGLFQKNLWQNKKNQDIYVVSNAGGPAVLTVDEISRQQLNLGGNFDLLGDADAKRYQSTLKKLLINPRVNNVLVILTPQNVTQPLETAQVLVSLNKKYPHKLIMASFLGGPAVTDAKKLLEKNNVPVFDYPEEAILSFKKIIDYKNNYQSIIPYKPLTKKSRTKINSGDYLKSLAWLKKYGIKTVRTTKYSAKTKYQYPVVLKAVGPNFLHKSEKGAVITNLSNAKELKLAAKKLNGKYKKLFVQSTNYLVVQPQIEQKQEIIVGFKRDKSFGPILMLGLGGIYTEIFKEVVLITSDLNYQRAQQMIKSLKIYPLLSGARNQASYDVRGLAQILLKLAKLANEHPEVKELDINPVFLQAKQSLAADVRIII